VILKGFESIIETFEELFLMIIICVQGEGLDMEVENGEVSVEEHPDSSLIQPNLAEDQDNKRRLEDASNLQNNKRMKPEEIRPQESNP